MADNLTAEQRSRAMSRIRGKDTGPELRVRQAVWARGLRGYRVNVRKLPGCPDLVWTRRKVAVFVDGAFWHGHPSAFKEGKSGAYWDTKIKRNMARDAAATAALEQDGWTVLRFWDFEVRTELVKCVEAIEEAWGANFGP